MRALRPLLLTWAALMAVLLAQIATATLLHVPASASLFGLAATALVLVMFMRLRSTSVLMRLFGLTGLFWLAVLLGLGGMDPATRTDYPASTDSTP